MARSKARRNRKAEPSARALRGVHVLVLLGWTGAVTAAGFALTRLEPYALAHLRRPARLEWVDLPRWLEHPDWQFVLRQLESRLDAPEGPFSDVVITDRNVCPFVAGVLARSAWIERIERVTKQADGLVRARAVFRKPFAFAADGATAYLIDRSGTRLPLSIPRASVATQEWLIIEGMRAPPPAAGQRWPGDDVQAGLALANLLYQAESAGRLPLRGLLRSIDVSNYDGRLDAAEAWLRIRTTGSTVIRWGRPVGKEYTVEAPAAQKLACLVEAYRRLGRLPAGIVDIRSGRWVDVQQPAQNP